MLYRGPDDTNIIYYHIDWVTDELLSKIHDNPVLSEAFSDPALGHVLSQLQSNPQAVAAAAKDSPKVRKILFSDYSTVPSTSIIM